MPVLNKFKGKDEAESPNATAAGFGWMKWNGKSTMLMTANENSNTTTGMSVRGGMEESGGGRGSPMLRSLFRPSIAVGMKAGLMIVRCYSSGSLRTAKYAANADALKYAVNSIQAPKKEYGFYGSSYVDLLCNKSKGLLENQTKSCVASPESERTAFSLKSINNYFSLRSKLFQSSLLAKQIGYYFRPSFVPFSGLINFVTLVDPNFRSYQFRFLSISTFIMASNGSLARQNFHEDCEANINKQINMELYASYVYMSMAYYFDREDVAFPGLHKWFKKASDEEREHAEKFMKYQNIRGGRIVLQPIGKPSQDEWTSPLEALQAALELEKTVNQTLLNLHGVANQHNDPQLCDFLETNYLEEQVHAIKELSDLVTRLKRVGTGLGEHIFDNEMGSKAD